MNNREDNKKKYGKEQKGHERVEQRQEQRSEHGQQPKAKIGHERQEHGQKPKMGQEHQGQRPEYGQPKAEIHKKPGFDRENNREERSKKY